MREKTTGKTQNKKGRFNLEGCEIIRWKSELKEKEMDKEGWKIMYEMGLSREALEPCPSR